MIETLLVLVMLPLGVTLWRMIVARTLVDRVVALDMLTGVGVAIAWPRTVMSSAVACRQNSGP